MNLYLLAVWCYGNVASLIICFVAYFASFINFGLVFEMSFKRVSRRGCISILRNANWIKFDSISHHTQYIPVDFRTG